MGEQFGQRYPNGTPLQGAAMHLTSQGGFGPVKPQPLLTNGQSYPTQSFPQQPPSASFPNPPRPMYSNQMRNPSPMFAPPARPLQPQLNPSVPPTAYPHTVPQVPMSSGPRGPPSGFGPPQMNTPGMSAPPPTGPPPIESSYNGGVSQQARPPPPMAASGTPTRPQISPYGAPPGGGAVGPPMPPYGLAAPAPAPGVENKVPHMPMRPPGPQYAGQYPNSQAGLVPGMERLSVTQQGFNKMWVSSVQLC